MKIALISPKGRLYRHKGGIFRKSLMYQPLTLTTLAALIPAELHAEVSLFDEGIQEIPPDLDADLVGMTVITGTAARTYELARQFRNKGMTVVLGGPHVTLVPDEASRFCDAVCVGYAEESWPRLLRDFASGSLEKVYRQHGDISWQHMPFARRELFGGKSFLTQAVFEATRSCSHTCDFCVAPTAWGRKQYHKPVEWVIDDIRSFGRKKIMFVDLNLVADTGYARELFTSMIPLNIEWFGLVTVAVAHDRELLELMAKSGCRGVLIGFETISSESLNDAGKRFNSAVEYQTLIQDLHRLGISVQGCFAFGFDHDTVDVFDATAEFVLDSGIDLPRFAVLTPFPATPLFIRLESEGRILTRNWELYDAQHVVFEPLRMSAAELARGHEETWRKVYRWSSIAKRLARAGNFSALALSVNLGYRFYAHHLYRFYSDGIEADPLPALNGESVVEQQC